ncbi:MAG: hypothetical protein ACPLRH_02360 [Desulfotomaculales bacterium]
MPAGLQPNSPYTLFLIFILLLLATNPAAEQVLAFLDTALATTRQTVRNFRQGWETWNLHMTRVFSA